MAVKTCPTCQRKNGAHLLSCMFCRADLTAVSDVEELDIDALFQQTMLGDSALSSKKTFPKPVAASRPVSKPNPTPVRKRPAVVSNNDDELPLLDSDLLLELVDIPDSSIDPITDEFQPLFTLLSLPH